MNYWLRATALALASSAAPADQLQHALDRLAAESRSATRCSARGRSSARTTPRASPPRSTTTRARIRLALALAFAYPGVPMIYYGDEVGMHAAGDPDNRRPLPPPSTWDTRAARARRVSCARCAATSRRCAHGRYVSLAQPGSDVVAFARVTDDPAETLLFVANATPRPLARTLFVPLPLMFDALPLHDLLDGSSTPVRMTRGTLALTLPGHGCRAAHARATTMPAVIASSNPC